MTTPLYNIEGLRNRIAKHLRDHIPNMQFTVLLQGEVAVAVRGSERLHVKENCRLVWETLAPKDMLGQFVGAIVGDYREQMLARKAHDLPTNGVTVVTVREIVWTVDESNGEVVYNLIYGVLVTDWPVVH